MPLPELSLQHMGWTVGHWEPREANGIDFNAPYQRASVWTLDQRRALIKSFIMNIPVGAVTVSVLPYEWTPEHYQYRIIDGKQRVETVQMFFRDEFAIPAAWLPEGCHYEGAPTDEVTLSQTGRYLKNRLTSSRSLPALEYHGTKVVESWQDVPDKRYGDGRTQREPIWREVTPEELLRAEAEIFMLLNAGGTAQTDEDLERAAQVIR